eukprot:5877721-Prorocentrum_lima.AAC.1
MTGWSKGGHLSLQLEEPGECLQCGSEAGCKVVRRGGGASPQWGVLCGETIFTLICTLWWGFPG